MQTKVMTTRATKTPYLEHFAGGAPQRTELGCVPLVIGRSESADLTLPSSLVSREHARIERKGPSLVVRDLGSTNGTFLNGERVREAALADGDVLLIADFELTFYSDEDDDAAHVTQVIESQDSAASQGGYPLGSAGRTPADFVVAVRRFHAVLSHRALRVLFQPIASLEGGPILGYRALAQGVDVDINEAAHRLLATECRLCERVRQLARTMAATESTKLPGDVAMWLRLHPSEIGTESLEDSFERLQDVVGDERRIIVEVPDSAVSDLPYFRDFREGLARRRLLVAYSRFGASGARLREHREQPPDYVRLDASLTREAPTADGRLERVQALLEAAREIGTQVIASGVETSAQAEALLSSGCAFALGNYFGRPAPAGLLAQGYVNTEGGRMKAEG